MPTSTAGKNNLVLGSTGVLTDPGSDSRTWVWAHLYDTGALEITASSTPDSLRTVLAIRRICANAHYQAVGATSWYDQRSSLRTCEFKADLFYAFSQCTSLTTFYADSTWALPAGVSGMGTFYNDTRLVGGNGTVYSSSAYGYARMVIYNFSTPGYLTEV